MIGLLTALKLSEEEAREDAADAARRHLESIVRGLKGLPVESRLNVPRERTAMPSLQLVLDRQVLGRSAFEIARELKQGDPGVFVNERSLEQETLVINPMHLDGARTGALTRRRDCLCRSSRVQRAAGACWPEIGWRRRPRPSCLEPCRRTYLQGFM